MNIVTIILARGGSKGIPKKNIINFCGKPLIAWSIEQAKMSKYCNYVYVSSDDKEIISISEQYGARIITRPKKLASDTASSEDALIHAIKYVENVDLVDIDVVVFLQATSPVRSTDDIDSAIRRFIDLKADSLFSAALLDDFCIWVNKNNNLKSITYDYKKRGRRQGRDPCYLENGSIYIFKPEVLRKYKNRLGGKIHIYMMPLWKSFEIDKPDDIDICENYMKRNIADSARL